tara:strand:- start:76089 stop:76346 length:258 start_codon:yes stop_codon:yes gene_type:complete
MRLAKQVNAVLAEYWDPIGMMETAPEHSASEYQSYSLTLAGMVYRGDDAHKISEYLGRVRVDSMGLGEDEVADRATALLILDLHG